MKIDGGDEVGLAAEAAGGVYQYVTAKWSQASPTSYSLPVQSTRPPVPQARVGRLCNGQFATSMT